MEETCVPGWTQAASKSGAVAVVAVTMMSAARTAVSASAASAGKPAKELKDAKRSGMRVHGRTGEACTVCGDVVREVSFADSFLNYCPGCQTGGKLLADRRMSKLLK